MRILNWNIEWATQRSARGRRILSIVTEVDPDVICFTEATLGMIPEGGYAIESDLDYGYSNNSERRKVVLWSKEHWDAVESLGSTGLPSGRFVTGITSDIRFVGVCIPWYDAHVRTGRRDRARWQDHLKYLDAFKPLADRYYQSEVPVCITGDFNQRIPRTRQPQEVAQRLACTFDAGYETVTAEIKDEEGHLLIDHVAIDNRLWAQVNRIIPKKLAPGAPLSDHVGVVARIAKL
jgi:exonuclease III